MSGLQSLRTAFWSLAVSLGVLLLLFVLRPEVTGAVTAFFSPQLEDATFVSLQIAADSDSTSVREAGTLPSLSIDRPNRSEKKRSPNRRPTKDFAVHTVAMSNLSHSKSRQSSEADPFESAPRERDSRVELATQTTAPSASAVSVAPAAISRELQTRLDSLQSAVERLTETESARRAAELQRAAEQLKEQQQSQRLSELERQLQRLQSDKEEASRVAAAKVQLALPAVVPRQAERKVETVTEETTERFSLQIRRAEITEVLELLGQATGYNIVIGEGVTGVVPSANLRDVTILEAVENIIQSLGLSFEQNGQFIYVRNEYDPGDPSTNAAKATAKRDGSAAQ